MTDYPIIRLKPKTDPRRIRRGFPWIYDNELVTDRRTKAIKPGAVAVAHDGAQTVLGLAAINPGSKIFARILDRDPAAHIDSAWFETRLQRALQMRETMFDAPYYRLIHAEADGLPGVIIDRFGDVAVVQPNAAWADARIEMITDALQTVTGVSTVIMNGTGRARSLEGLEDTHRVLRGTAPDAPLPVPMNGATYMADVMGGQKTGLFYDQRPNHSFVAGLAQGARVLDVFSHVGGFALAALAAGATSALSVDGSAAALELAEQGADASGVSGKFSTRRGDAFDQMATLAQGGDVFDVVICDPPAFAPSKQALQAGLRAYEKVAKHGAGLVADGGYLCLCSCSHAADLEKFRAACLRGIGRAGRSPILIHTGFAGPDHPLLPQLAESGYLKSLVFRL